MEDVLGDPVGNSSLESTHNPDSKKVYGICSDVQYNNAPVIKWCQIDHAENCTKVFVAFTPFCGVSDYNVQLSQSGKLVTIGFTWPTPIFKAKELFPKSSIQTTLPNELARELKINSLKTALLSAGITENSSPKGSIVVELPIRVQTESGTWTRSGIKEGENRTMILEFKGYQDQTSINEQDTSFSFNSLN
jgi:hypothetical protein